MNARFPRILVASSMAASLLWAAPVSAVPLVNDLVPVGVIDTLTAVGEDAFGVAYDPVNDRIWHNSGSGTAHAFMPFKNLTIGSLPIDGVTGLPVLTTSTGGTTAHGVTGIQALGFNSATGDLVIHNGATPGVLLEFAPFTATPGTGLGTTLPAGTLFLDGLDVEGSDVYTSSEPASTSGDSYKNGALFLDNTSFAQTDISAVSAGTKITRWAGIEAVTSLGQVYAVAEVDFGGGPIGRTIATYDLLGGFTAVDADGSPFAARLEDLAFDGRYLYGGSIGDHRIFVFDIVGPGGTVPMPEPETMALLLAGLAAAGLVRRRRRAV